MRAYSVYAFLRRHLLVYAFLFPWQHHTALAYMGEVLEDTSLTPCKTHEVFSFYLLQCLPCDANLNLVPSGKKDSCVCNKDSVHTGWNKSQPNCVRCPLNTVANSDHSGCIKKLDCGQNQVGLDRTQDGALLNQTLCLSCSNSTLSDGTRCIRPGHSNVSGPQDQHGDTGELYRVNYETQPTLLSQLLKRNLDRDVAHCTATKNFQSCDRVANLCVLQLYAPNSGPCAIFRNHHHIPWSPSNEQNLPWLYYGDGDAITVLTRKKISAKYSVKRQSELNWLNLTAIKYSYDVAALDLENPIHTVRMVNISGADLQLCYGDRAGLNNALRFGTFYRRRCTLYVADLLSRSTTDIFELFLRYRDESGKTTLYAIPTVINTNMKSDMSSWQLVRRYFLVDTMLGVSATGTDTTSSAASPSVIRYVKSAILRINVQRNVEDEGKIYPPLLILHYGEIDISGGVSGDETVETSFSVEYHMSSDLEHFIDVVFILLFCLVIVWSGIQTWSNSRRNDRATIDLFTLIEMGLIMVAHLSNVLFSVSAFITLYIFLVYKCQDVMYRVVDTDESLRNTLYTNIYLAFILKLIEITRLVYKQIGVDIFFIDWERPRPCGGSGVPSTPQPVSIWRTYFIANEWNEIQSKRKTNLLVQILVTVYLLKIVGLENLALAQPELNTRVTNEMSYIPEEPLLKLGVAICTYLIVYLTQWLLLIGVYENFIKNGIHQFVDLCSVANVSVFILTMENYGYYIHGRSAHGFADTDMESMANQMLREEEDSVGHRGLLPGTDQQTFEMTVPRQLRTYYKRVMAPLSISPGKAGSMTAALKMKTLMGGGGGASGADINRSVQAYNNMNKFLAAFLEHALKDLDYQVKDKMFVEALLDIEFTDTSPDKGVFYIDNGHSFDSVLFYGAEFSLFSLELMLFTSLLIFCNSYLCTSLITIFVVKVIAYIRDLGGKSNLAKKTLIDERFLI